MGEIIYKCVMFHCHVWLRESICKVEAFHFWHLQLMLLEFSTLICLVVEKAVNWQGLPLLRGMERKRCLKPPKSHKNQWFEDPTNHRHYQIWSASDECRESPGGPQFGREKRDLCNEKSFFSHKNGDTTNNCMSTTKHWWMMNGWTSTKDRCGISIQKFNIAVTCLEPYLVCHLNGTLLRICSLHNFLKMIFTISPRCRDLRNASWHAKFE